MAKGPTQQNFVDLTNALKAATAAFNAANNPSPNPNNPNPNPTPPTPNGKNPNDPMRSYLSGIRGMAMWSKRLEDTAPKLSNALSKAAIGLNKFANSPWGMALNIIGAVAKKGVDIYNKIANVNLEIENLERERKKAIINYQKELAEKTIQFTTQIGTAFQEIKLGTLTDSFSNSLMSLTDEINESAYAQLRTQRSRAKDLKKAEIDEIVSRREFRQDTDEMETKYNADMAKLDAKQHLLQTQRWTTISNEITGVIGSFVPGFTDLGTALSEYAQGEAQRSMSRIESEQDYEIVQTELKRVTVETTKSMGELGKQFLDSTDKINEGYENLTKFTEKNILEFDKAANRMGVEYGYGGRQLNEFKNRTKYATKELAAYGKTMADAQKWQASYVENSDRAVNLSNADMVSMASLDLLFGEDGLSAKLTAGMNIFNTSIQSGNEMMLKMYHEANKVGISNKKFAADLEKSLKQAQKYQFRGGVEGVAKMALWAQKVRFNMDELDSILSKMHTGNIEDVIQTSARLNVLGGNAAILSDPMGMLFNAYTDPAQYVKNINDMIAGYGHFNRTTGETEFNINEQMRLEAISAATGESKENLLNQVRQKNKKIELDRVLAGSGFSKEDRELIDSKATYNKDEKRWEVGIWNAAENRYVNQDITKLSENELKSIRAEGSDEKLPQYVKGILDWTQQLDALKLMNYMDLMVSTYTTGTKEFEKRIGITGTEFAKRREEYKNQLLETMKAFTDAYQQGFDLEKEARAQLSDAADEIKDQGNKMASAMEGITKRLNVVLGTLTEYQDEKNQTVENLTNTNNNERMHPNSTRNIDYAGTKNANSNENNIGIRTWRSQGRTGGAYAYADDITTGYWNEYMKQRGQQVNDLIISPNGTFETDPEDTIIARKPGGSLDQAEERRYNSFGNNTLTINGTLKLDTGRQSIDLMEILRNNPNALRELAKEIIVEGSRTTFGGKHQWAPNRYTFGS